MTNPLLERLLEVQKEIIFAIEYDQDTYKLNIELFNLKARIEERIEIVERLEAEYEYRKQECWCPCSECEIDKERFQKIFEGKA